jgi:hypothetical protein
VDEEEAMPGVGSARIGQWYVRSDKGESFQVTGLDEESGTIEIQTFDGDLDEVDADNWRALPLELAEPPEDWTGPVDDVEVDDLGYSQTEMRREDWEAPLQPLAVACPAQEAWEDKGDSQDEEDEGESVEQLAREEMRDLPKTEAFAPGAGESSRKRPVQGVIEGGDRPGAAAGGAPKGSR